ncbi:MAG: AtpZ/AtpI family protein [Brevefilum sp.]|nr:AtpZ/AtpI family protein [Brevefilum sp.]
MDNLADKNSGEQSPGNRKSMQLAWIPLQAGCLTFALAVVAILVGLWLDARLGTAPRWTLILLIGSAPFALAGVFLIVRRALHKMHKVSKPLNLDEEP